MNSTSPISLISALVVAVGFTCTMSTSVWAKVASDSDQPMLVDTIVVTARKLKEDPRKVPFSVITFDGQTIANRRIDRTEDLFRSLPNVAFSSLGDGRSSFFAIRGNGPISQPLGYDDTSVVTYVDGVPQPLFGSDIRFLDLARIEVLRGPQGTVFGRNAQAGAVSIITRQPDDTFRITARGEYGSDNDRLVQASVSGPIVRILLAERWPRFFGQGCKL